MVFKATSVEPTAGKSKGQLVKRETGRSDDSDDVSDKHSDDVEYRSLYVKPFHAAKVIDPLLTDAKPSHWTTVSDNDVLMRQILEDFFRCEYQFTAAFQKDLFLEDMASGRKDFCSSLLVNVTLAYACVRPPRTLLQFIEDLQESRLLTWSR